MRIYGMVGGRVHPCDQQAVESAAPKRCGRCGLTKPADRFAKKKRGLDSMCRDCRREYDRERYRRMKLERSAERVM